MMVSRTATGRSRMPPLGTLNAQIENGRCASDISGLTDASALPWRLQLRNIVVGWRQVADRWDDAGCHAALYVVHGYRIRQITLWSGLRRRVLIEAGFSRSGFGGPHRERRVPLATALTALPTAVRGPMPMSPRMLFTGEEIVHGTTCRSRQRR
jgi:hypothetical protein